MGKLFNDISFTYPPDLQKDFQPAAIMADTYLSEEQNLKKQWIENLLGKTPGFHFLGCLFARYFSIDMDKYSIDLKPVTNQPQMAVLRNELAAYLPMPETERQGAATRNRHSCPYLHIPETAVGKHP